MIRDGKEKILTSLLGVRTMMKKRTSCEFLPMFAACFSLAIATCLFCKDGRAHLEQEEEEKDGARKADVTQNRRQGKWRTKHANERQ